MDVSSVSEEALLSCSQDESVEEEVLMESDEAPDEAQLSCTEESSEEEEVLTESDEAPDEAQLSCSDESSEEEEFDEEEDLLDLEDLGNNEHPCLRSGSFSIFHHPQVCPVLFTRDVEYTVDLDGVSVLSKKLSTFRVGQHGEERLYFASKVENVYQYLKRAKFFPELPTHLASYAKWLPSFTLFCGTLGSVRVVMLPKAEASVTDVTEWHRQQSSLTHTWWHSILLPSIHSLPPTTRTRRFNTTSTFLATDVPPTYVRVYEEDVQLLDSTIASNTMTAPLSNDLEWYFVCTHYGQQQMLREGEVMGPDSFGLPLALDLRHCTKFCAHIAMNLRSTDPSFSLFWDADRTNSWSSTSGGEHKNRFPLFGLRELANITVGLPMNPSLEGAIGCHNIVYLHHYTPTVKALENRIPLQARPHLLTYLLGKQYVSRHSKFSGLCTEVERERTRRELFEVFRPDLQMDARFEVVITEDGPSFLSHFRHRTIARLLVVDRLLVKIPVPHFPMYVRRLVNELWDPLQAAVNGTLTGRGTLATVLLCETLLSFLPTAFEVNQPRRLMKAYDVLPVKSSTADHNRIDLRHHATTRQGVLYIRRPRLEKVWVPLGSLPRSARKSAKNVLDFLEAIREVTPTRAVSKAAEVLVCQFRDDLVHLGVVNNITKLDGDISDGTVVQTMTATEYIRRVLQYEGLPQDMSTKSLLKMAIDIFDKEQLTTELATQLLHKVKTMPKTTVHSSSITFSKSHYTLLLQGDLALGLTTTDAHRLVLAAQPLLTQHFPSLPRKQTKKVMATRPTLTRAVKAAVHATRRRAGRTSSTRHLLAVACTVAVMLAEKESIVRKPVSYRGIYRSHNLSRYVSLKQLRTLVRQAVAGQQYRLKDVHVLINKLS